MSATKIVLADDHAVVRNGLRMLLDAEDGLIALGHTNSEIAGKLCLSVRTVESHRAHIQRKTGRTTRAELVRYALDHELVE